MVTLPSLWMPIVVAAVLVFLVSSILHMVLKYHRADYKQLPDEDQALADLRKTAIAPGYYVFPFCAESREMQSEAMQAKYRSGPVGMMTILPSGAPSMGKFLGLWFVFTVVVSFFVAYVTGRTVGAGEDYLAVFRVAGATAFLAYGIGELPNAIWRGAPWANTARAMVDGLIYALVTAGTFGWLWPR